jgi:thiamine monophosphate kinase
MAIQEMNQEEIDLVSGASKTGAYMTLGGAAMGVVGTVLAFTPVGAAVGGVIAIGGAAIGALAYAYDHYDAMNAGRQVMARPKMQK